MPEKFLGAKFDVGKVQYGLVEPKFLADVAAVLTDGAAKYSKDGWKHVPSGPERYMNALMRHVEAHRSGQLYDSESNYPHMVHVACNAMFLHYFMDEENSNANTNVQPCDGNVDEAHSTPIAPDTRRNKPNAEQENRRLRRCIDSIITVFADSRAPERARTRISDICHTWGIEVPTRSADQTQNG